jgi:hypothetical protein
LKEAVMSMPVYLPAMGSAARRQILEMQPEIGLFPARFAIKTVGRYVVSVHWTTIRWWLDNPIFCDHCPLRYRASIESM